VRRRRAPSAAISRRTLEGLPPAAREARGRSQRWGRDYSDVSPIRGVILGGGEQRTHVAVDLVRRESETTTP